MTPTARRVVASAVLAAVAGVSLLMASGAGRTGLAFDMDRDLPTFIGGFHGPERFGDETWSWTRARASIRPEGLDRSVPWTCALRARGSRPADLPQPVLTATVDGVVAASFDVTNTYEDLTFPVPPRDGRRGASIVLTSTPAFVPGGGDSRELGVQVDRLACQPAGRSWRPAPALVARAAAGPAVFAVAGLVAGLSLGGSLAASVAVAAAGVLLLGAGGAAYGSFPSLLLGVTIGSAAGLIACARIGAAVLRRPLAPPARGALAVSSVAVVAQLGGLLHPAKGLVDALFQAHRLQAVLDGNYFFTQPMPDGVVFPYAIGLYVFAAPWTRLTDDFVTLLRVVVVVAQAFAGGLLYAMIARAWRQPRVGVLAVALFHLVPLPYGVVGNGNLTNAFGQAVALAALATATIWTFERGRAAAVAGLAVLTTLAFCSHVSTVALLGATLVALGAVWRVAGGPVRRSAAVLLVVATVVAAVTSFAAYYGRFMDVYETAFARVIVDDAVAPDLDPGGGMETPGLGTRASVAIAETMRQMGWPLLLLAFVGGRDVWRMKTRGEPLDALTCLVLAWTGVWAVVVGLHAMTPVDAEFQRYAVEFVGRVNLATYPAVVVLAARAVGGAAWRLTSVRTWLAGVGFLAAVSRGVTSWLGWFA